MARFEFPLVPLSPCPLVPQIPALASNGRSGEWRVASGKRIDDRCKVFSGETLRFLSPPVPPVPQIPKPPPWLVMVGVR